MLRPAQLRQLQVRCCCQPQKLLGWVLLATGPVKLSPGSRVTFKLRDERPPMLEDDPFWRGGEELELQLQVYIDDLGIEHLAIRAENVPLAQLLRIDGFFPAH